MLRAAPALGAGPMTDRIQRFLAETQPETPCLVVDLEMIETNYLKLQRALPLARVFYAVKANPAPEVVARLAALGASFDTASRAEIELCLAQGATPDRISFGNTIKKQKDIAWAYEQGVRLFAFDSDAELDKLIAVAPGAGVFCRLLTDCGGAERSEERRGGTEWGRTCRSRWSPYHKKKK